MSDFFFQNTHTRTDIKLAHFSSVIFFSKHAHTHRSEFLYMVNFSFQNFHQVFFFYKTRTHVQICLNFHQVFFFFYKTRTHAQICLNFHPYFFKTRTHAQIWILQTGCTDIDVIKMADFSSVFVFKIRTHAQIWILQSGLFVSSQNVWIFILACFWKHAHTHRYRCYKDDQFFIRIFFSKHAQTWILQSGLFVSSQNIWIVVLAVFWKHAHTHTDRCYKDGRFFIRIFFSEHSHTHELAQITLLNLQNFWMSEWNEIYL